MDHVVMFVLKWHHLHDYFPWPPSHQQCCSLWPPPTTTEQQRQQMASHLTSPTDKWLQPAVSHLTSPTDKWQWWMATSWSMVQMVTMQVIITVHKFRWGPCLPSLSPFFTWEPRGHIAVTDMATNFRFPFANNIAHPWSVPHVAVASLCLQGSNRPFLIYIVRFLSR